MSHTPTPWHVEHDPRWVWANIQRGDRSKPDIAKGIDPEDAKFIVAACNAHEAMRDALRIAEYRLSAMSGAGVPEALEAIRAALAKAEPPATCPHGKPLGYCDACDVAADFAYDAAREDRMFKR